MQIGDSAAEWCGARCGLPNASAFSYEATSGSEAAESAAGAALSVDRSSDPAGATTSERLVNRDQKLPFPRFGSYPGFPCCSFSPLIRNQETVKEVPAARLTTSTTHASFHVPNSPANIASAMPSESTESTSLTRSVPRSFFHVCVATAVRADRLATCRSELMPARNSSALTRGRVTGGSGSAASAGASADAPGST